MSSPHPHEPGKSGHSDGFNLSAWAIKRPIPAILLFIILCGAGLFGYSKLPISKFPDISMPLVSVSISLPGATPAQLETEVTRKVEDALASLSKVKLRSTTISPCAVCLNVPLRCSMGPTVSPGLSIPRLTSSPVMRPTPVIVWPGMFVAVPEGTTILA